MVSSKRFVAQHIRAISTNQEKWSHFLTRSSELVKPVFTNQPYRRQNCFGKEYTIEQTLFKNLGRFRFEPFSMQEKTFINKATIKCIGKQLRIFVCNLSNLNERPTF